jgi:hypothetical protein
MRIMLKHTLNISNRHAAQELEENTRRVTSNITQSINALLNISLHTGGAGGGGRHHLDHRLVFQVRTISMLSRTCEKHS